MLLLAPEAFLPLRNVGASYHAATEGIEAAGRAFAVIEAAAAIDGASGAGILTDTRADSAVSAAAARGLRFDDVSIEYDDRRIVSGFTAEVDRGSLVALSAPSGAGKSSLLAAALGFTAFEGSISVDGTAAPEGRRAAIAWAGQRPGLLAGTIASNVALGADHPDRALVVAALHDAAAGELDPETPVDAGGGGLSGGQAQRVAVARALYRLRSRGCSVLLLDEPTSALDSATEAALVASLRRVAASGTAVLVVSHRPAVVAAADVVIGMEVADRVG